MNPLEHPLGYASTFLFVPATRPDRFAKALNSGAHGVILDLEDAVAEEDKEAARAAIRKAWPSFTAEQQQHLVIRSNAPGTRFYSADLILAEELNIGCLLIPKAESLDQVNGAAEVLPDTAIIPMIETALGLHRIHEIANAQQVIRLALGNIDLQADLGMVCDAQESELQVARFELVLASRLAEIAAPIDGVTPSTDDSRRIEDDAQRAKRLGFGAKLGIHPTQIPIIAKAFAPTDTEIDWAKRVIKADQDSKGGVVKLDGRMIDRPVVILAKRLLALAGKH
ncbi:MAG: CoA ester lyase [Polynucleobacter sp.]|nr:CoA ester lyase [Polynucleobacter sp.]